MKKGITSGLATVLILLVIIILVFLFYQYFIKSPNQKATPITENENAQSIPEETENVVEITSTGFKPNLIVIKKGESVTWINKDTESHWPASNIHPTHKVYPGSGLEKCGTTEESQIFDACEGLAEGESYTFTFNSPGSWKYHDHLRSGYISTVSVQS